MAIVATDWTITRSTKVIAYIGHTHTGVNPSYATVIEFHRWLQGLADDAVAVPASSDQLDITNIDPSRRSTDNIITLINGYTISQATSEHLYDGSIIQGTSGSDIWDGIVNFGNAGVLIQLHQNGAVVADDWWNYSVGGSHTGATNPTVMTDSALSTALTNRGLGANDLVGYTLYNVTDGSFGIITANTTGTITVGALVGGTDNDFDTADVYKIGIGVNNSTTAGISHRWMQKVRTASADIDLRKLLGTNRRFGYTYGEFSINATSRGNNVLALSDSADLNNTTNFDTVDGWTSITNSEGYALLDVDNNTVNEAYYSEWNKDAFSINQFYERAKFLTADGSTETLYGLNGELFRGITHQVAVSGQGVPDFVEPELLTWTGGTGQLLAADSLTAATKLWIQLLTGVPPTGTITGAGGATVTAGVVTERPVSKPFVGASTGSALIGAYGLGVEVLDLASTDKVTDLDNNVVTPPNNVTNTVAGLAIGEDRVLVGPWDGTTLDVNGDPAFDKGQYQLNTALTTDNITAVVIKAGTDGSATILPDTPSSGYIRVTDNNGFERRLHYSSWTGSTFTIDTVDGNEDFAAVNASANNLVWIAYIDELAGSSTATFTSVQAASRDLVVLVRDGGGSPIKQFISSWSQTTAPQTITAIRTTDV